MTANGVPEGWTTALLADVAKLNPPKPRPDALPPDSPVSFVPMPAVDAETGAITVSVDRRFSDVRKGYTAFADGDVILAKITPCFENGKAAVAENLTNGLGFGSSEFHVLRPSAAVGGAYLYHYLRQQRFRDEAKDYMTGAVGQARVPADYLARVKLPLPPLDEQVRIVSALQALLPQVPGTRQRLANVSLILRRSRQSLLGAACSGRLTEDWRETKEQTPVPAPAGNVGSDGQENSADFSSELPTTWSWIPIDDACSDVIDYRGRTPPVSDSGIPHLRTTNVRGSRIDWNTESFVSPDVYETYMTRGIPRRGDVVFTMEAPLGEAAVVDTDRRFSLAQRLLLFRGFRGF